MQINNYLRTTCYRKTLFFLWSQIYLGLFGVILKMCVSIRPTRFLQSNPFSGLFRHELSQSWRTTTCLTLFLHDLSVSVCVGIPLVSGQNANWIGQRRGDEVNDNDMKGCLSNKAWHEICSHMFDGTLTNNSSCKWYFLSVNPNWDIVRKSIPLFN